VTLGWTFVGVPIDSVGRSGGTEHGPAKLRELGLAKVCGGDAGDLDVRIRGEERDPVTGIVGSPDVLTTTATIREAVAAALSDGEQPFLAGGCCAELPGALAGARDVLGRVGVAYLDGHLDLYDGVTSPTGEGADMPLSVALGLGPKAWVDVCGGASARIDDVVPIGYRDPEELPTLAALAPELGPGFRPVSKDELQTEGSEAVGERIAGGLVSGAGRFWLHLDVDVLGEDVFPATDYLMPNGLDLDELVALMRPLGASPSLVGVSLGCYNPEKDPGDTCGRALVDAFASVLRATP
jgi:arginase